MKRTFIVTAGLLLAFVAPFAAEAQSPANVPRIGVLSFGHKAR